MGLLAPTVIAADAFSGYYGGSGNNVLARDPFTTSDKMYSEVGIQSAKKATSQQGFVPGYAPQAIPKMRLKGFVTKSNNKSAALLEIDGVGIFLVSAGEEIGLHAIGQNSVIKIIDVGTNGIKVQSGQINQVIVVR
ncbi:MAG: hypothetical protein ABL903_18235 [Methylococcales bacterium]